MSTKSPKSRNRKRLTKDETKIESVAAVHKPIRADSIESVKNEHKAETDDNSESNRTFTIEDNNENTIQTLSRDISIDAELQINSKIEKGIIGFMETEIKTEKTKYSHFTDSRPQSLSFYEEERAPEELSGQLEQLSPEEKRLYKRKKDERKIDIELDASTYKEIQNVLNREKEEALLAGIMKSQKSKSRKKKQFDSQESIAGIGDSREQMIPNTRKKTKKSKKHENSPNPGTSHSKKKHRKRDEYESKNDITVALEELQDDVFEKDPNEIKHYDGQHQRPEQSNTIYVQKRNGFEATPRDRLFSTVEINRDEIYPKSFSEMYPIDLAVTVQKYWLPFTILCHGLLAGLALSHMIVTQISNIDNYFVQQYKKYSEAYTSTYFFLCAVCLVSVFDRYDIKHMNVLEFTSLIRHRKSIFVIFIYIAAFLLHLINATSDDCLSLYNYIDNFNETSHTISQTELDTWSIISFWRSLLAIIGWIIIALAPQEDSLYEHLRSMKQYLQANS